MFGKCIYDKPFAVPVLANLLL